MQSAPSFMTMSLTLLDDIVVVIEQLTTCTSLIEKSLAFTTCKTCEDVFDTQKHSFLVCDKCFHCVVR